MKRVPVIVIFVCASWHAYTQQAATSSPINEQQLENIVASNDDVAVEDDSWLQQMQQFIKHPIELNISTDEDLIELHALTVLQRRQFLLYRDLCGKLISVYELQAVPGWDIALIKRILPFVTVSNDNFKNDFLNARNGRGEHSMLLRVSQTLERSKAYSHDSSTTNYYPGSPQRIFLRYTYHFKNLLQWGIVAEKDPGEQFLKGKQKLGFDFYSFHIFLNNFKNIRSVAIGDFTVNMGQGLIQWQTLAFTKSADIPAIKREGNILQPYHSSGEINFHRGLGITIKKKRFEITAFASYQKLDGNFVVDTLQFDHISSFQTSGYHRTKSETDDEHIQSQTCVGGNLTYFLKRLRVGLNAIHYRFCLPLVKPDEPYNKFALAGNSLSNFSFDYAYTFRNIHFFGEIASTERLDRAMVNGMIISTSTSTDIALLYRDISP
ncbi:MAG TPA: hypothetical protein VKH37_04130, partial [Ferruginibacter sp.]|nr:hypothetical protein [Ferruginibacter sp.]